MAKKRKSQSSGKGSSNKGKAEKLSAGESYKPKVGAEVLQDEFTLQAVILGMVLSVLFGAANAYLGLKVGMTVSASIPAAVIGMGVLRGVFRRGTLLETNMVQTVGSAGESLAAGVIFTVPAIILIARDAGLPAISATRIFVIAAVGGLLGIFFMIPLRRFLIVQEHENLPFPEGTACAKVLDAGQAGGGAARTVFLGLGVGALYKLILFFGAKLNYLVGEVELFLFKTDHGPSLFDQTSYKGAVGSNLEAALLGVGFILGPKIGGLMLSGAVVGWLVLIPLIAFLGATAPEAIYPSAVPIAQMSPGDIWNNYIRYIGAGAVAFGGVLSLIKALPMIWSTLTSGVMKLSSAAGGAKRTERDLDSRYVLGGVVLLGFLIWVLPTFQIGLIGTFCTVLFAFLFTTVSARIVGIVGSSSNPASGMTIATLLATAILFVAAGYEGIAGMLAAITVGSIVCIGICIGGDTSQDLKTGFLVGATPWRQQIGEMIGVLASAAAIGFTLLMLDQAYQIGSAELAAPQATLMKLVVQGVMRGDLPWAFVAVGAFMGAAVELLGIGCLPFAVGLYLPFSLSAPIMVGGLIRWAFEAFLPTHEKATKSETGVLLASGLIAGEATMGVGLAAVIGSLDKLPPDSAVLKWIAEWGKSAAEREPSQLLSLVVFGALILLFVELYLKKPRPEGTIA